MKRYLLFVVMILSLLLGGCGVFPREEVYQSAPTIPNYKGEEWKFAYAQRGNMTLTQSVVCTYVPVQTQTLDFSVSGLQYDEIFVSVGETVKKGQLLAQLDLTDVNREIAACQLALKQVELKMASLEENRGLELQRQKLMMQGSEAAELDAAQKKINDRYDLQKQALQDEMDITRMQLEECNKQIAARQLRAQIDGTATYVRTIKQGERSVAGERVIVIEDSMSSVFQAETKHWSSFVLGQEYAITVQEKTYVAVAVSEKELGLPETQKAEGFPATVYLKLQDKAVQLEEGDRGMLELEQDSRQNVIMIPETAVKETGTKTIVYYPDDNGLKAYKEVEVGLTANGMIEIISGIAEGECVIAG